MEADLAFRGVDLGALWSGRRWRLLLNLIDHLPRDSFYVEAVNGDDEVAAAMGDHERPAQPPRLSQWSPESDLLAVIADRLGVLIDVGVAAAGGTPKKIDPLPRPETAAERAKHVAARVRHEALVRRLLPKKGG